MNISLKVTLMLLKSQTVSALFQTFDVFQRWWQLISAHVLTSEKNFSAD